jgi:hypothetical protein
MREPRRASRGGAGATACRCGAGKDSDAGKRKKESAALEGLFGKWRIEVDGRGLKGILGNFEL